MTSDEHAENARAAAGLAGLCALLVGAATLRLRHDYLAIATFGIAVTIQLVALNFVRLTNGPFGIAQIPRPLAGWAGTPVGRNVLYLGLVVLVVAATYVGLERLVRSPWGRVLRGLREDEHLRLGREQLESPRVALFDLADDRVTSGKTESSGEP